jgi:hypothetical protein
MSAAILLTTYLPSISARAAHLLIEEIKNEIKKELKKDGMDNKKSP